MNNGKLMGKILIEIDLDKGQYNVAFSETDTLKLFNKQEIPLLYSSFHAACIVNELRRRRDQSTDLIVKPSGLDINQITKTKQ
jgi:hypothetical protein